MPSLRYAWTSRVLHWLLAVMIVASYVIGSIMAERGERGDFGPETSQMYFLHKSFGFVILALVALRILARVVLRGPGPLTQLPPPQRYAAHAAHVALYGLLIAVPLAGWAATSAGRFMEPVFGLFSMPELFAARDPALSRQLFELHENLAFALVALAALHGVIGLYHAMLGDGVFPRMWFGRQKAGEANTST